MKVQTSLLRKLGDALAPLHLELVDESRNHGVPPGSESHFKLHAVSAAFEGKSLVERHRLVNQLLAEELRGPVHALTMKLQSPAEWEAQGSGTFRSPPCLGGSKQG